MSTQRLRQLLRLPSGQIAARLTAAARRRVGALNYRLHDFVRPTFGAPLNHAGEMIRYFQSPDKPLLEPYRNWISALAERICDHRFDLLGSGPVSLNHGASAQGLGGHLYHAGPYRGDMALNRANRTAFREISALLDDGYEPIDWQRDFKSGYRWSESTWYMNIGYGALAGVDIKVPWELARMQHLPILVWAHILRDTDDDRYQREVENQIIDFIAHNPPRFGVNWRCTMDVAIRAANWLAAWDLGQAAGMAFRPAFEAELVCSLKVHGAHIMANLEWDPKYRGNHYLANVVGLLYLAAYLPGDPEVDGWLTYAAGELKSEVLHQFNADGSNIEASAAYHRLSAEMAVYGTALMLGLGPEKQAVLKRAGAGVQPCSQAFVDRVTGAKRFLRDMTKPNGTLCQVGDNDSGRFFKFFPNYAPAETGSKEFPWRERSLDADHLVAAFDAILAETEGLGGNHPETVLVASLAKYRRLPPASSGRSGATEASTGAGVAQEGTLILDIRFQPPGCDLLEGLKITAYPDFGIYLYRSRRLFLSVRCGDIGLGGRGAHAHNDQLAVELNFDGTDWVADPGSYLYTPWPCKNAVSGCRI